jgi:D-glycero-D-manno-heptose 1,7-bisphosphate phosphatase
VTGAIFLDRDGVINQHAPCGQYVLAREQFRFLPRARSALAFLNKNSERRIVVVTNQSPIGRRRVTGEQMGVLHAWMVEQVEDYGGRVDAMYVCPHTPEERCACRKPRPGLFLRAAEEMGIDLAQSVMVGDTVADILAAQAAGVPDLYRVCCGLPLEDPPARAELYTLVGTLAEAAVDIVGKERDR